MYISVSRSKSMDPAAHLMFDKMKVTSARVFGEIMASSVWSPILWLQDKRLKAEFLSCKYAALDFDSGEWTLQDAMAFLDDKKLSGILGTSKSHQIAKGSKPACDRFRLVIPFAEVVVDRVVYEATMRKLAEDTPCDKACVDAARYFFPCKQIQGISGHAGTLTPALALMAKEVKDKLAMRRGEHADLEKPLPQWAQMALEFGVAINESRHKTCYRLGALLHLRGMTEDQIVELCLSSPIGDIGREDIGRAVHNGALASEMEATRD
jgi:hypothetical protein